MVVLSSFVEEGLIKGIQRKLMREWLEGTIISVPDQEKIRGLLIGIMGDANVLGLKVTVKAVVDEVIEYFQWEKEFEQHLEEFWFTDHNPVLVTECSGTYISTVNIIL